jgi:predicted amidohydrolase
MNPLRVAAVQFEHVSGDKEANFRTIEKFLARAAAEKVDLINFPECCITGYSFLGDLTRDEIAMLSEPVPTGPSTQRLVGLSRTHDMIIGAGLVEQADDGALYNTYVVALPDGSWRRHRKLHCFISEHMASGDNYTFFHIPQGWKIGILICYDNNIGENARINGLNEVDLLLAPHQTGGADSADKHAMKPVDRALWENRRENPEAIEAELKSDKGRGWILRWLPARAHDNGMFYLFCNGVGIDGDDVRTGNAMILDPYGRIMVETWKAGDDMVIADLDPGLLEGNTGRRWMKTRRPELYQPVVSPTGREIDTRQSYENGSLKKRRASSPGAGNGMPTSELAPDDATS